MDLMRFPVQSTGKAAKAFPACCSVERSLRVAQVSTTDLVGGAGLAATRLHDALLKRGVESRMLVVIRRSKDDTVSALKPFALLPGFASRILFGISRKIQHRRRSTGGGLFSLDRVYYGRDLLRQLPNSNLIHLHWIVDMLDYTTALPELARRAPLIWTFHDMNCFTGGCHYDGRCGRFAAACGFCPQLASTTEYDLSRQVFLRKQRSLAKIPTERLVVICPSDWMARAVSRSLLFARFRTVTIPYGVDAHVFKPTARQRARSELGLPADAKILLFVSEIVSDRRKGFAILLQALEGLCKVSNLLVVTVGSKCEMRIATAPHRHLHRIEDPSRLALVYSAADVFIVPSMEDNLPNTVLEAMSCGLPVIAFRVGGIPEVVRDTETGLLVDVGNATDLAQKLLWILEHSRERERMSAAARSHLLRNFTEERQAAACEFLYQNHLSEQSERCEVGLSNRQRT